MNFANTEVFFHAPQVVRVGAGARHHLAAELQRLGLSRVLLVTDRALVERGITEEFTTQLDAAGIRAQIFADVQPDPTDRNVHAGLASYRDFDCQALVALGGGSPMDAAKVIGVAIANPGPLQSFQGYYKIEKAGPPLIAIPTTAGTGSEVSKAAVITNTETNIKMMMFDAHLMPRVALVDYELSLSMPHALTAHVGVDTFTHGLEAYVSRKANGMTDPIALSCVRLSWQNLRRAWMQPDHRESRAAMAVAACQGGMAFTNSSVCLVHGMSRPLGAIFHLPHGLSNAVLLPTVTRFSLQGAPERYSHVAAMMNLADEGPLADALEELNQELEIGRLRDYLRGHEQDFEAVLPKMAADALASGSPQNNPVVPTAEEIIALYREAW